MMEELPFSSSNNSIFERPHEFQQVNNPHKPKIVAFGFSHVRPDADMTKDQSSLYEAAC